MSYKNGFAIWIHSIHFRSNIHKWCSWILHWWYKTIHDYFYWKKSVLYTIYLLIWRDVQLNWQIIWYDWIDRIEWMNVGSSWIVNQNRFLCISTEIVLTYHGHLLSMKKRKLTLQKRHKGKERWRKRERKRKVWIICHFIESINVFGFNFT